MRIEWKKTTALTMIIDPIDKFYERNARELEN